VSLSQVKASLVGAASTALGSISHSAENEPYTIPTAAKWGKISFMPAACEIYTLGTSGSDDATGILQIDLSYPLSTGTSAADTDHQTIRTAFVGKTFTSSGQSVTITSVVRRPAREVDNFYRVTTDVYWTALVTRT
jgi:hypothetical protein